MKRFFSLLLLFALCLSLCSCAGTSSDEPADPQICVLKNSTITYKGSHTELTPNADKGTLYVDFNFEVTGDSATSMHFSVLIKAFQDGVEITHFNFPSEQILPGYSKDYTYKFDLHNTESPVLIQYCSLGVSKVISEFTVDIAP